MHVHEHVSQPITFAEGDEDHALVLPPLPSDKVCAWCRGLLAGRVETCLNCEENAQALDGIVQPIVAVSIYSKPGSLRDWLTFYKDDGETLADPIAGRAVGRIFAQFIERNPEWIASLELDGAVVVPSTVRPPPHPLAVLLQENGRIPFPILTGLSRTSEEIGHNRPHANAFRVAPELIGKRILLLDDVYASGARSQSAAYALRSAGVTVAALFVLARRYNPDYSEDSAAVYAAQRGASFSWNITDRLLTQTSDAG